MALNKAQLKSDIKAAFVAQQDKTENPEAAIDDLADKISTAIDSYIKGATIFATPAGVASAALSNGAGPVVSANNLVSNIN